MIIRCFKFILFVLLITNSILNAQTFELGVNLGYNFSRLTVKENNIAENLYIRKGTPFAGPSLGGQLMISPPVKQSTPGFSITPSVLLEASLCRCGGNVEITVLNPNGKGTLLPLSYLFYRGDFSLKFVAGFKNFQFLIGPTLTHHFYAGFKNSNKLFLYANANDHIKSFVIGYEFGPAIKVNTIQFSLRYHRVIGAFSEETNSVPTTYRNYQVRLMLHYYFLKKSKGLNWNSIYWK